MPYAGPVPQMLLPNSPNVLSPVLSPSFWPPSPFSPFSRTGMMKPQLGRQQPFDSPFSSRSTMLKPPVGLPFPTFDFNCNRTFPGVSAASGLATLFMQHGLEKYIGRIVYRSIQSKPKFYSLLICPFQISSYLRKLIWNHLHLFRKEI